MQITIEAIAILILVSLIYGVLFAATIHAISWISSRIYSFLSRYTWFTNKRDIFLEHIKEWRDICIRWWRKNFPNFVRFLEYNYEIFGDIAVIGFGLGFMVERIHDIQTAATNLESFIGLLVVDMMIENYVIWLIFGVLLILWFLGRRRSYLINKNNNRQMMDDMAKIKRSLDKLDKSSNKVNKNLNKLVKILIEQNNEKEK